jgi:hypothetical protein
VKNRSSLILLLCVVLTTVPLSLAKTSAAQTLAATARAQGRGAERVFHHQKTDIEKAIHDLHATLSGRLPTLDGFADMGDEPLDRFTRGYYECAVNVEVVGQDETRVIASAKITAWYTDPAPSKSGYRELPSNGHVEEDLLDRIEDALAPHAQASAASQSNMPQRSTPGATIEGTRADAANSAPNPYIDTSNFGHGGVGLGITPSPSTARNSPSGSGLAATGNIEDTESLKRRREEAEKQLREKSDEVKNLEEILRNQSHPTDLAVVRKSGTRVMPKPNANGPALFSAEGEDEFQVLEAGADWVRVQISGASRGWIRRSDLILPEGLKEISSAAKNSAPAAEPPFRILREETNTFKGNWESLNGKKVKIIWAAPASTDAKPASGAAKKSFAKTIFAHAYREISAPDSTAQGVVLVVDSADGGQIAATAESLKQWQNGIIAETIFWKNCSVDPPDFFDP